MVVVEEREERGGSSRDIPREADIRFVSMVGFRGIEEDIGQNCNAHDLCEMSLVRTTRKLCSEDRTVTTEDMSISSVYKPMRIVHTYLNFEAALQRYKVVLKASRSTSVTTPAFT